MTENSNVKTRSEQTKAKISASLKGKCVGEKSSRARAVINCDTGEIFATARLADEHYGWKKGVVTDGLRGKHLSRGYRFEYYDVYVANGNKPTPFPEHDNAWLGKKHSEQTKQRISESLKALNLPSHNNQTIINLDTGELFESMTAMAEKYNVHKTTLSGNFAKARKKGQDTCRCAGHTWKYYDPDDSQCIEAINKANK